MKNDLPLFLPPNMSTRGPSSVQRPSTKPQIPKHEENAQLAAEGKYKELFQRNFWFFWRLVGKRIRTCPMQFDDLFQEVFLNFIQKAHNWDPEKSMFTTYFYRAAWHWMGRMIHYWCSGRKSPASHITFETVDFDVLADAAEDTQHNLMNDVIASDSRSVLLRAIRRLKPKYQFVIISRFFADKTLEEISEEIGVTREAVRQQQVRALKALKRFDDVCQLNGFEKTPQLAYEA